MHEQGTLALGIYKKAKDSMLSKATIKRVETVPKTQFDFSGDWRKLCLVKVE